MCGRALPFRGFSSNNFSVTSRLSLEVTERGVGRRGGKAKPYRPSGGKTELQFRLQPFVHNLRVGFAFGSLDDLAHEEAEERFLAGAILFELRWVTRNHFV